MAETISYTEENIRTLDWKEHIRLRPGMYIGKLGDGSSPDDGIYILIKEVIDNSIDEYAMGNGKSIDITIEDKAVTIRDYGRGIPLGSLEAAASKMNTGGKYDSKAFKKSVGLNGVGIKAVNALSSSFVITSVRDGRSRTIEFSAGNLVSDNECDTTQKNGTQVSFTADESVFGPYGYNLEYIETMVKNYTYLNSGLIVRLNGTPSLSKEGLLDLLGDTLSEEPVYKPIHLKGEDIEIAMTHGNGYGETYYSFVNGQHTTQGGTHQAAFRESVVKVVREFYRKDFDANDIRMSIIGAISIKVEEPLFESQTKTKLGSKDMAPGGPVSVRQFVADFMQELDNYLHKNPETAEALLRKILESEKERKGVDDLRKKKNKSAKKTSLNNSKLRDCRIHLGTKNDRAEESTIFITEGDSASGSITKSRDVNTQAVFSLRGKPLNTFGLTKKVIYENDEFNLLQAALDIEDDIENLRYNKIVIATDADVDGMHIRLLMITFFIKFFPDIIRRGHLYILQTPLFRVRNKKETCYCYSEEEKQAAIARLKSGVEITRFKGLGEISPDEFRGFIVDDMRI
ncbi:MAG: ATP-binding protein, partial [Rikenellaceae bacterium]|nr:ATP-binding protein [Rikenellaceae bacterium]